MDNRQEIKSLRKALRALTVMNQRGDATVTEIARAIGTPRTTAYRLLTTLASEGYVEKQPHSDYYRLTSMVTQLGSGFQRENLLLEIAKPLVSALGERVGWSISLSTPRAADMVTRITTNHDTALALDRYMIGLAVPMLHATAGFCYLASCSESERDIIIGIAKASGNPLQALANNRPRLDMVLERVRSRGFSNLEFPSYREGNVGVPLVVDGKPVGGLVMRYIKSAMTGEKLLKIFVPELQQLARDIAERYAARAPITFSGTPADAEPAQAPAPRRRAPRVGATAPRSAAKALLAVPTQGRA
jgi:IclR family mhp operon transcriptional activator